LGRHKNPYRQSIQTVAVSKKAAEFIKKYGGTLSTEPFYRRLDRLVANYQMRDTAELHDVIMRQSKIIEFYHKRIKELESNKQSILVP